jgi:hypothetical protein
LLEYLLRRGGEPVSSDYMSQLPDVTVVSHCGCGCPTIDFAVRGLATSLSHPTTILADGQATTPEGVLVGVILHARDGLLSELEVYSMEGVDHPFSLPQSDAITLYTTREATPDA